MDIRSADDIESIFFQLHRGMMDLGTAWKRCSAKWMPNGAIGSTEFLYDGAVNRIMRVRKGDISFRRLT